MSDPPNAADIFHRAGQLPVGAKRDAYLDAACGVDEGLRAKILVLLAADTKAGAFLVEPDGGSGQTGSDSAVGETAGQRVGRYKLLQQIGEGGFGTVWMAEQREPIKRRVALKIIKLGMDTRQVIARFEAERQALALMDHPNIAMVFDAGASDAGRPFFVMELVNGIPLVEYCDAEELATGERLSLFVLVCQAIQHAHQKGIIHRDIKPSNVLVTMHDGVPVPKVIDFGIAKATNQELTQKTLFTEHRQIIGTPAYMSPEQAEMSGLDIDTRADVYSLGVLLYELLTGTTPFDVRSLLEAGYDELLRAIREDEPHKPSTRVSTLGDTAPITAARRRTNVQGLGTRLRGDLDWIVMKCLEKDRRRRYETANGLAADIQRHLVDEPVAARPPTFRYRMQKVVKRHRVAVIATAAVAAVLVLGVIGTTGGMVWAFRQTARAEIAEEQMQREKEAVKLQAYRAALAATSLSYQNGEFVNGRRLLAKVPAELRGWIWKLLDAQADEPLGSFEGSVLAYAGNSRLRTVTTRGVEEWRLPGGERRFLCELDRTGVSFVTLTPDGALVLLQSRTARTEPKRFRVLEAESGDEIWRLEIEARSTLITGHHAFAFMEGDSLVVADARTGAELARRSMPSRFRPIAWSPDGRRLAATSDALGIHILDVKTLAPVPGFDSQTDTSQLAVFSPDGRWLACARWGHGAGLDRPSEVVLRDTATGRLAFQPGIQVRMRIKSIQFSPDGERVAVIGLDRITLLHPATGRIERTFGGRSMAFDPDGSMIGALDASGSGLVWAVRDQRALVGHQGYVYPVAYSPDGRRIVSGGWDGHDANAPGCIRVWDAATGDPVTSWGAPGWKVTSLAFTPDGTQFLTCGTAKGASASIRVRIWDAATGALVEEIPGSHSACAISPDGSTIVAIGRESLVLIDRATGKMRSGPDRQYSRTVLDPAFRPDGRRVAMARPDHSIVVSGVRDLGTVAECFGHTKAVASLVFSADGSRLLTGSADRTIRIWSAETGEQLALLHGPPSDVMCAIFSPDGDHVISGHRDGRIRYWHIEDREVIAELTGHWDYVYSLSLAPDGQAFASGSGDGTVRIWGTNPPSVMRRAIRDRRVLVAGLSPVVTRLFDELTDPAMVVKRLRAELTDRKLEVALQIALAESVRRRE